MLELECWSVFLHDLHANWIYFTLQGARQYCGRGLAVSMLRHHVFHHLCHRLCHHLCLMTLPEALARAELHHNADFSTPSVSCLYAHCLSPARSVITSWSACSWWFTLCSCNAYIPKARLLRSMHLCIECLLADYHVSHRCLTP